MINSIQQFCGNGAKRLTDIFKTYTDDLSKIAEMVYGLTDEVTRLGCSMIAEGWESCDELLRKRKVLRQGWHIVRMPVVIVDFNMDVRPPSSTDRG